MFIRWPTNKPRIVLNFKNKELKSKWFSNVVESICNFINVKDEKKDRRKDFSRIENAGGNARKVGANDHWRDNRARWRSISGFDESAERPISRRSTIKKGVEAGAGVKNIQDRLSGWITAPLGPAITPIPFRSRANGVTGSCGTRCATWREGRRGKSRRGRLRRRRRRSRAHVSNLKYVGVVWMGLADASRRPNMFTPFVRSTPV